jgi:hydrogenase expression/formation protein HypE
VLEAIEARRRKPRRKVLDEHITLSHGAGGKASHDLIEGIFLREFSNELLAPLGDSALVGTGKDQLAFTTDSFVVRPLFFPGGDIGELAVNGTINDLSMTGATPLALSASFNRRGGPAGRRPGAHRQVHGPRRRDRRRPDRHRRHQGRRAR